MVSLSTRTPRAFSAELLSSRLAPSVYDVLSLFLHRVLFRTLHFPLLNFMRFLTQFSSLSRSTSSAIMWCFSSSSQFCIICELAEMHSVTRSLMKLLNTLGPSNDPWVTPLLTVSNWTLCCWSPPSMHGHSVSFQSISLYNYLAFNLSAFLWGCSRIRLNEVEVNRISCSPLIVEGYRIGQVWFLLCKPMLTDPNHLCLEMVSRMIFSMTFPLI